MTRIAKNGNKNCNGNMKVPKQIMEVEQQPSENEKIEKDSTTDPKSEEFHGFTNDTKNPKKLNSPEIRSRSRTPQNLNGSAEKSKRESKRLSLKKDSEEKICKNGTENGEHNTSNNTENGTTSAATENGTQEVPDNTENGTQDVSNNTEAPQEEAVIEEERSAERIDMEPLVLVGDEDHPELQFDEDTDKESGQNSPVLRCRTRRSSSRNIPTPKTPKSLDSESNSVAPTPTPDFSETDEKPTENLNETHDSADLGEVSTQAEAGSDSTRLEFVNNASNATVNSDDSFLSEIREKSLKDTLRGLTPRRAIRPLSGDYLKKAIKNSQNKSYLNLSEHDMINRIGIKRKSRSITPEERKKFKQESTIASYLSSPLNIIKNRFKSVEEGSMPKLTGYKDHNHDIHEERNLEIVPYEPLQDKRSWCSLM